MFQFKIEQIAIATDNPDEVKRQLAKMDESFGGEWTEDHVKTQGFVYGSPALTHANLSFHYDTGIEFEILEYTSGKNWHSEAGRQGTFISHIGMHVDEFPELPFDIIQDVETLSHSNEFLIKNGRKYYYRIYNTRGLFGFDLKLIKRRERKENEN